MGSADLDLPAEPGTRQVRPLEPAPAFARWRELFAAYEEARRKVPGGGTVPRDQWKAREAAVEATLAFLAIAPTGEVIGRVVGIDDLSASEDEQAYNVTVAMHEPFVPPSA